MDRRGMRIAIATLSVGILAFAFARIGYFLQLWELKQHWLIGQYRLMWISILINWKLPLLAAIVPLGILTGSVLARGKVKIVRIVTISILVAFFALLLNTGLMYALGVNSIGENAFSNSSWFEGIRIKLVDLLRVLLYWVNIGLMCGVFVGGVYGLIFGASAAQLSAATSIFWRFLIAAAGAFVVNWCLNQFVPGSFFFLHAKQALTWMVFVSLYGILLLYTSPKSFQLLESRLAPA